MRRRDDGDVQPDVRIRSVTELFVTFSYLRLRTYLKPGKRHDSWIESFYQIQQKSRAARQTIKEVHCEGMTKYTVTRQDTRHKMRSHSF